MPSITPAQQRFFDKRRELEAFEKVLQQAEQLVEFYSGLGDKFDVLGQGSQSVANVVEHWQNVFRITHLALASLEEKKIPVVTQDEFTGESKTEMVLPEGVLPDKLVRIPIAPSAKDED